MPCFRLLAVITLLVSFSAPAVRAQSGKIPDSTFPGERDEPKDEPKMEMPRKGQTQRLKKRHEDLKRDSQRLLDLATELKTNVDRSGENILSLDVVRKAEEMEKLAKQVKNNMRSE